MPRSFVSREFRHIPVPDIACGPPVGAWRIVASLPVLAALAFGLAGCRESGVPDAEVATQLQSRFSSAGEHGPATGGQHLLEPAATERFYQSRKFKPAWASRRTREQIVGSIRDIERDGLTPADYHLPAIQTLMQMGNVDHDARAAAELDLLLTDAVAGMIDHVRYGR